MMKTFPFNKIIHGNSADIMPTLPAESVDLCITSPPYDDIRDYNGYEFCIHKTIRGLKHVLKPGGVIVWVVGDQIKSGNRTGTSFQQALEFNKNFTFHDYMFYEKPGVNFSNPNRYLSVMEFMFIFSKGKPKTTNLIKDRENLWAGGKVARQKGHRGTDGNHEPNSAYKNDPNKRREKYGVRNNVWRITGGSHGHTDDFAVKHPATFPEALARDHILTWSNPDDVVLDIFSGSGTTAKMAMLTGRKYLGIEISKEYCELSEERIREAARQGNFFLDT